MKNKKLETTLNIFLSLASPLLLLALLEGTAFVWEKNQAEGIYAWELVASRRLEWIAYPDPKPGYTLMKPGSHYEWQGIPVDINSNGLRSPETSYAKPEGTYRLLNLGDSVAMGWGVKQEETYGQVLAAALNARSENGTHYEVINAGVPGWNLENVLAYLQAEGLRYQPDLILLEVTIVNDIFGKSGLLRQNQSPVIEWLRKNTYSWPFLSIQLQWIQARTDGKDRIDVINPPRDAASYFPQDPGDERWDRLWSWIEAMADLAEANGSEFGIILFPMEYQVLDEDYSTMAQSVLIEKASAAGLPVLDLLPAYRVACQEKPGGSCQLEDRYLFADVWMHPSALGHQIASQELEIFLSEIAAGLNQ
jgi:hypothetical protein